MLVGSAEVLVDGFAAEVEVAGEAGLGGAGGGLVEELLDLFGVEFLGTPFVDAPCFGGFDACALPLPGVST